MNINIVTIERRIIMVERISFFIDFGNIFILLSLNILNSELEEDLNINESENFNIDI